MQENTAKTYLDPFLASLMKKEVDKSKNSDQPVNRAFERIAEKSGLKFNTVKNYYYRYIHEKDNLMAEPGAGVGKTVQDTTNAVGSSFTKQETKDLMMAMLSGQAKGKSVRGCANELAQNDKRLMLRYQNKYRNVLARNPEYVEKLMDEMSGNGLAYYDPFKEQIIHKQNSTSDNELLKDLGRLVSNINEINSPGIDGFIKGLQELTGMAVQYKYQNKKIDQARLLDKINDLIALNKNFLDLPITGKLVGLTDYLSKLGDCIVDMESVYQ